MVEVWGNDVEPALRGYYVAKSVYGENDLAPIYKQYHATDIAGRPMNTLVWLGVFRYMYFNTNFDLFIYISRSGIHFHALHLPGSL